MLWKPLHHDATQHVCGGAARRSAPETAGRLEDASRQLQQELQQQGTLRGKPVPVMVKVPDPDLEATSGAVRVWRQQIQLVQAVYEYMCALQAVEA